MTGLRPAFAAEWTKLWSVRSTYWCLAASVLLTGGVSVLAAMKVVDDARHVAGAAQTAPAGGVAADGAQLGQFALIALAAFVITVEYASGSIRTTLQADPRRGRMLLAKALVIGLVAFAAGIVLGIVGNVAAHVTLGDHGTGSAADVAMSTFRIAAYVALVGMLTVGVGAALRSAAGVLTTVFVLLVGLSLFSVGEVSRYLPAIAGMEYTHGNDVRALVVLAWTAAALIAGRMVLQRRDA